MIPRFAHIVQMREQKQQKIHGHVATAPNNIPKGFEKAEAEKPWFTGSSLDGTTGCIMPVGPNNQWQ